MPQHDARSAPRFAFIESLLPILPSVQGEPAAMHHARCSDWRLLLAVDGQVAISFTPKAPTAPGEVLFPRADLRMWQPTLASSAAELTLYPNAARLPSSSRCWFSVWPCMILEKVVSRVM